jgi:uncharacterized protein
MMQTADSCLSGAVAGADPGLGAKLAFLRDPASYPVPDGPVEVIETHMSWVFLLRHHVYKLKKPVRLDCFDCRTLAKRRFLCDEELRLNRRLAPTVYLTVLPLTADAGGRLALDGVGEPVDWLVKMVRLPAAHMLDHALHHGRLADGDTERIAAALALFYSALPAEPIAAEVYRATLQERIDGNLRELALALYRLPHPRLHALHERQSMALRALAGLLDERVRGGKIIEGHGDLRPEHIWLGAQLAIFDCLEFSRPLRIVDRADEIGFLALECERLGAVDTGLRLLDDYRNTSGDMPAPALIHFYQSCRASTRATLAARHMLDPALPRSPHWLLKSRHYLRLAEQHVAQCR